MRLPLCISCFPCFLIHTRFSFLTACYCSRWKRVEISRFQSRAFQGRGLREIRGRGFFSEDSEHIPLGGRARAGGLQIYPQTLWRTQKVFKYCSPVKSGGMGVEARVHGTGSPSPRKIRSRNARPPRLRWFVAHRMVPPGASTAAASRTKISNPASTRNTAPVSLREKVGGSSTIRSKQRPRLRKRRSQLPTSPRRNSWAIGSKLFNS